MAHDDVDAATMHQVLVEGLRNGYVFCSFDDDHLTALAQNTEWIKVPKGEAIITKGLQNTFLYILIDGGLQVESPTEGTNVVFARITPGNVVGELGFVDRQVSSATIRAEHDCELLRLKHDDLSNFFVDYPATEARFLKELVLTLSERLRNTNNDLVNALRYLA